MDVISAILKPIVESLMVPVKKHFSYMVSYKKYVKEMDIKMTELDAARIGVEEHLNHNRLNNLKIPLQVNVWLEEVGVIKQKVEDVPSDVRSCFHLKFKHMLGKEACNITEEIESVNKKHLLINWTNDPIPLGRVVSMKAFTSTPSTGDHQDFESRKNTFMHALKTLEPTHKSHMIALCGMGGVGKTTMMKDLKQVVKEKKMFNFIVEAVVGEKTDPIAIQQAVADYFSIALKEKTRTARSDRLRKSFQEYSDGGKNKILVILDDIWELVDLNDIGLSPLPNQGVDFKVLLTSRDRDVCSRMGVKDVSIIDVKLLTDLEGQNLFRKFVKESDDVDLDADFHGIGDVIVNRCQGLPIAIKTIASNLRCQSKEAWEDALSRLKHHDTHEIVHQVFKMSYKNLKDETKSIFLLCGLYPDDFNIPTEDLMRYGWGLKLFHQVYTIRQARNRLNTCIEQLIHANLLIGTHCAGWVKMHDLVRDFALSILSKGEHASIVKHGNFSEWPAKDMRESCKSISLTCKGTWEYPGEFKYPNLSLLKLMHGDNLLRNSQDFYGGTENLQVIAYERMHYVSFPRSLQCSTNLRTLCLEQCSLTFDCSLIGNLWSLEVLSFAHSGIQKLPSIIGNLHKLKLLDLSGCINLRIDNGVFNNLVKLEELYMRVDEKCHDAISFTGGSYNDLAECSKHLSSLEFEFFKNSVQPKNISFEKLERFNISIGCFSKSSGENLLPFESKLTLVTNKGELLGSKLNELFVKTHVLYLQVSDMNDLEEVGVVHTPRKPLFYNLRFLIVSACTELRYLFTPRVASALSKLEDLQVYSCPIMETLIHIDDSGSETIIFPMLKCLILNDLPKLSSLCHTANVIELPELVGLELYDLPNITNIYPNNKLALSMSKNIYALQALLKEEVVIPKLEKLRIERMQNLEEIWSSKISSSQDVSVSMLRELTVKGCDNLASLFPINPMPFLLYLQDLEVGQCDSIEVLFDFDLGYDSEIMGSSSLSFIELYALEKLKQVWRMKGVNNSDFPIHGFQALESLRIHNCTGFRNLYTPTMANFDLRALTHISMVDVGRDNELAEISHVQEVTVRYKEEILEVNDDVPNAVVSAHLMLSFQHLHELHLEDCTGREVVFEIEDASRREFTTTWNNQQLLLLPDLKELYLRDMDKMRLVWKFNWNKFFLLQQQPQSSFHNLMKISLYNCKSIKYLFAPLMIKLLHNLKEVKIQLCHGIEEVVVSNRDEGHMEIPTSISTHIKSTVIPILDNIILNDLKSLWQIGGGGRTAITSDSIITTTSIDDEFKGNQVDDALWSICQYSRRMHVSHCNALPSLIPSHAVRHMQTLEELVVRDCESIEEIFETRSTNKTSIFIKEGSDNVGATSRNFTNMIYVPQLGNLKKVEISGCDSLQDLFTFSSLESLKQLKELEIKKCKNILVIVKEDDGADTSKVVIFPCLKCVKLVDLPNLKSFFLGINDFRWHLLDNVQIKGCPNMTSFTRGRSTSPMLEYIDTNFGKYNPECGLNFHMITALKETPFSSLDVSSSYPTLRTIPWSFSSLINVNLQGMEGMVDFRNSIIPSNELQQLEKLEKILVKHQHHVEEVFEALKRTKIGSNEAISVIIIPNLREVDLAYLGGLKYIWKSNHQLAVLKFPNLTRLSIKDCKSLAHVFTCSMVVGNLLQLQELNISHCDNMEVVVHEEEDQLNAKVNEIMFPSLKSLKLKGLGKLEGFCLRREEFQWPSLVTLEIISCSQLKVFTTGKSTAPKLKVIDTDFGIFDAKEDPNSFIRMKEQEVFRLGRRVYNEPI